MVFTSLVCASLALAQAAQQPPKPADPIVVQGMPIMPPMNPMYRGLGHAGFTDLYDAAPRPMHGYATQRTQRPRVTINGRFWHSRPLIGPEPAHGYADYPGAEYGAAPHMQQTFFVRAGNVVVGMDPFTPITRRALKHWEAARIQWLSDNGYVGGVRTFRNDAYMPKHEDMLPPLAPPPAPHALRSDEPSEPVVIKPTKIEPRAIIKLPADMPRVRGRMQVQAEPATLIPSGDQGTSIATVRSDDAVRTARSAPVTRVLAKGEPARTATQIAQQETAKRETKPQGDGTTRVAQADK